MPDFEVEPLEFGVALVENPTPEQTPTELDRDIICPNIQSDITLYVYHPFSETSMYTDGIPEEKLPVVVFMRGEGQDANEYDELFLALAAAGFVIVSIGEVFGGTAAGSAFACALRYLAVAWEPEQEHDVLNCDTVFIGHSRGGEAAYLAVGSYEAADPVASTFNLRAVVQIAPSDNDVTNTNAVTIGESTVPLLTLTGATDNDTRNKVVNHQEFMGPETDLQGNEAGKAIIWAYDVEHDAFGGGGGICPSQIGTPPEKGAVLTTSYIPAFLRWQALGDVSQRALFTGKAYPEEVLEPTQWEDHYAYEQLTPADCSLEGDETSCESTQGCWWRNNANDCVRRPLIMHGFTEDVRPGQGERCLRTGVGNTTYIRCTSPTVRG